MGVYQKSDLRVRFDRRLRLKFFGSTVTTDAGSLAYWELDETLATIRCLCSIGSSTWARHALPRQSTKRQVLEASAAAGGRGASLAQENQVAGNVVPQEGGPRVPSVARWKTTWTDASPDKKRPKGRTATQNMSRKSPRARHGGARC